MDQGGVDLRAGPLKRAISDSGPIAWTNREIAVFSHRAARILVGDKTLAEFALSGLGSFFSRGVFCGPRKLSNTRRDMKINITKEKVEKKEVWNCPMNGTSPIERGTRIVTSRTRFV